MCVVRARPELDRAGLPGLGCHQQLRQHARGDGQLGQPQLLGSLPATLCKKDACHVVAHGVPDQAE
jgi:hypothetical protein